MLTRRQKEILDIIEELAASRGYGPSLKEIADRLGIASPSCVFKHLAAMEKRGVVRRRPGEARSVEVVRPASVPSDDAPEIPLLGKIAAGRPIEALEAAETIRVPADLLGRGTHYVLKVSGDSMTGEYIADGDFVVVREAADVENGELTVALVDEENATLKRLYREADGRVRLQPSNPAFPPIMVEPGRVRVRGVVVGVMRKYR